MEYPFLTHDDFVYACQRFLSRVAQAAESSFTDIRLVQQERGAYIRIAKQLKGARQSDGATEAQAEDDAVLEIDSEELVRHKTSPEHPLVEYHVALSASYRVPVLYIFLRGIPASSNSMIEEAYKWLVPTEYKQEFREVGTMGALSYAEHPILGVPALSVHPCNTPDVMKALAADGPIAIEDYILVWLGVVGARVGLETPWV